MVGDVAVGGHLGRVVDEVVGGDVVGKNVEVERHHHHKHHNILAQQVNNKSNLDILESGNETGFETPAASEKVSKGNCCVPIKRTNQQVAITGNTLATFKSDFEAQYNALYSFLYGAVNTANTNTALLGNQATAVRSALNLPDATPAAGALTEINNLSAGADASAVIEIEHSAAINLFGSMIRDLMHARNRIEYGLLAVKKSPGTDAAATYQTLRLQQKTLFDNTDKYFAEKLTPARFHYKAFSRLPVNVKAYVKLSDGLKLKVSEASAIVNSDFPDLQSAFANVQNAANGLV